MKRMERMMMMLKRMMEVFVSSREEAAGALPQSPDVQPSLGTGRVHVWDAQCGKHQHTCTDVQPYRHSYSLLMSPCVSISTHQYSVLSTSVLTAHVCASVLSQALSNMVSMSTSISRFCSARS